MTRTERPVLARVRRWLTQADPDTDADLLRRFADRRDEGAFTSLVDRHGPMVLGVACRVTADGHAAEDVFQATFLALARRASGLHRPAAVAAWLHRTAHRLALTAIRARGRRQRAEAAVPVRPARDPLEEISGRELVGVVDEELRRLPERYQQPLVLCCLEGRSPDEAATLLGWSPGSLRGRLERGRRFLRARLARRGLTFAVGAGTSLLLAGPQALPGALRARVLGAIFHGGQASPAVVALVSAGSRVAPVRGVLLMAACGLAGLAAIAAVSSQPPGPKAPPQADKPLVNTRSEPPLPAGAVAQLGWDPLRLGHAPAALSSDGKRVIAVSAAAVVHVFDASTGKLLDRRLLGDRRDFSAETAAPSLSADGSVAAVAEHTLQGTRVTVYNVSTGKQLLRIELTQSHALSPDGRSLAAIVLDDPRGGTLRVYDLAADKQHNLLFSAAQSHLWFAPDRKRLLVSATAGPDALVCFDVAGAKEAWQIRGGGTAATVTPDSRIVFLAKPDTKEPIRALDLKTGRPAEGVRLPNYQIAGEPAVAGDRLLFVPLRTGEVAVWDYRAGKELRRLRATPRNWLSVRAFPSLDGKTAVTDGDGLRRWDLATGEQIFGPADNPAHFGPIQGLAFLPDGALLSADTGAELRRWNVAGGHTVGGPGRAAAPALRATPLGLRAAKVEWSRLTILDAAGKTVGTVNFPDDRTPRTPDTFWQYALLGDGRSVVTYFPRKSQSSLVTVTDYVASKTVSRAEIPEPVTFSYFQGFSPCGRWLMFQGQVYAVASGRPVWAPSAGEGWQVSEQETATFSTDGRLVSCRVSVKESARKEDFERGEHDIWEIASGMRITRLTAKYLGRTAISPDNRTLAYATGYGVHVIDLTKRRLLAEYEDPGINCTNYLSGEAQTLAFSPDGRSIATGHLDGSILVWNVPRPAATALSPAERDAAWADLASSDAMKARAVIDRLARDPDAAIALLAERFKATQPPAEADVPALIKALDSPTFATREKTARQLREVGPKARPALQEALKTPTPEAKERIERLLAEFDPIPKLPLSGEALRGARAIEVLERIGTPAAKTQLRAWAEQTADLSLAAEAGLAQDRLRVQDVKSDAIRK
jgi:RNA polymerase sigma factor (sigma-70 family)